MKISSNVKTGNFFFLSFLMGLMLLFNFALAAQDEATVNVKIEEAVQISVQPKTLSWEVYSGEAGTPQNLDIYNTGSKNVTQIHAYVDTLEDETERPYGSSNATKYAAGGVIVFRNSTNTNYYFAGRIEWNWTEDISNMNKNNVNSPVAWGFFKNTSFEYVWLLGSGSNGYCNDTDAEFAIEDDPDDGSESTRTPETTNIVRNDGDANFGYFSINRASSPLYESCVAAYYDCTKIYIYKYDKRSGFSNCENSMYIQETDLPPGQYHTLTLNVYVPRGIPAGNLNTATFTVYATG
ncbi:MAG: hypothetical protein QXL86_03660 [Candidatus Aenigmatarchaeota archaeon]